MTRTLYEVLEVESSASVFKIRESYRRLVTTCHPDVPDTGSASKFKEITDAWKILCDDKIRTEYDQSLCL